MIIKTNIWGLGDAIKDFGKLLFDIVEGPLQIWINVIKRVMEGDFKGAISAIPEHLDKIKKGFADLGASSSKAVDNMSASWDGLKTKVSEIKAQMAVPATVAPGNVPTKDMPSGSAMPNPEMEAEKAALNLEQLYVYKEAEQEILAEWDLTDQERKIIQDQADKDRSLAMDEFLKMNYADRARMLQSNLSSENAAKLLKESEALKNKKLTNEELKKEEIALYNKYAELREQDKQDNYTLLKLKAGDQASFDNMMVSGMHSKYAAMRAIGKAFAIRNAIQDTYSAALGGYKAMVGIPIVGPGLAIAAAAAASAFGMARVAEIASAAEGGVVMPKGGGQLVQVAEAGAPEAIIPLGDKRAENIMGSSGVTVNLHVGAFMGNESDAMAFAKMIDENLYKAKLAGETISI